MRALIISDGLSRQALEAARALAAAGWQVGCGTPNPRSLTASSRSVSEWHRVRPASDGPAGFGEDVAQAIRGGGYDVVFGARDDEVALLSFLHDELPARVAHPPFKAVCLSQDKLELERLSASAGFAAPRTTPAREMLNDGTSGRWLVKPRVGPAVAAAIEAGRPLPGRASPRMASGAGELADAAAEVEAGGDEALAQEPIDGSLIAIVVLAAPDHSIVSSYQQRSDRTWPLSAGISVRARIVEPDPQLTRSAAELVGELGWSGIAQIQLLAPDDGAPRVIDFNGRFYGSIALARVAGSEIVASWAASARGAETHDPGVARVGTRYQWLWGDLRRATQERRGGLLRDLAGTILAAPGAAHSLISLRDPRPAMLYARRAGGRSLGVGRGKRA